MIHTASHGTEIATAFGFALGGGMAAIAAIVAVGSVLYKIFEPYDPIQEAERVTYRATIG